MKRISPLAFTFLLAGISIYRLDEAQSRTFKFFDPLRDVAPQSVRPVEIAIHPLPAFGIRLRVLVQ